MKTGCRASDKDSEADIQLTPLQPHTDEGTSDPKIASGKRVYQPGLVVALARTFGGSFCPAVVLKVFYDILTFASPLVLK